jgi:hypothetical protein
MEAFQASCARSRTGWRTLDALGLANREQIIYTIMYDTAPNCTITGLPAITIRPWIFSTIRQPKHDLNVSRYDHQKDVSILYPHLAGKIVYSLLRHEEDSGREYALHEFTPCAAIESLQSFLPENGQQPVKRRFVPLSARMSCLQSTLHDASKKEESTHELYVGKNA